MKLQPHYFCPGPHSSLREAPTSRGDAAISSCPGQPRARPPRIRKGDVKACYVRIRRRWVSVGTICLDCAEFVSEL